MAGTAGSAERGSRAALPLKLRRGVWAYAVLLVGFEPLLGLIVWTNAQVLVRTVLVSISVDTPTRIDQVQAAMYAVRGVWAGVLLLVVVWQFSSWWWPRAAGRRPWANAPGIRTIGALVVGFFIWSLTQTILAAALAPAFSRPGWPMRGGVASGSGWPDVVWAAILVVVAGWQLAWLLRTGLPEEQLRQVALGRLLGVFGIGLVGWLLTDEIVLAVRGLTGLPSGGHPLPVALYLGALLLILWGWLLVGVPGVLWWGYQVWRTVLTHDGVAQPALFRRHVVQWRDVRAVTEAGTALTLHGAHADIYLAPLAYQDSQRILAFIRQRATPAPPKSGGAATSG